MNAGWHVAVAVQATTPAASAPSSDGAAEVSAAGASAAGAGGAAQAGKKATASSWSAKAAGGVAKEGKDYLYEVGRSDVSMNVDTAQNSVHLDSLFTGNILGHKSDIADGTLRYYEFRSFDHIIGCDAVAQDVLKVSRPHILCPACASCVLFLRSTSSVA